MMMNEPLRVDTQELLKNVNLDAANTMFFARELEEILNTKYNVLQQPLSLFTLMPTERVSRWATTVTYEQFEKYGEAKIVSSSADDIPLVNTGGVQLSSNIREIALGYSLSIQEIEAAAAKQKPLEAYKLEATIRGHYEKMNILGFHGDTKHGLVGWLTSPLINKAAVAGGNANAKLWATKKATPQLILDDLNEAVNYVRTGSGTVHRVNTIAMTPAAYAIITQTRMDSGTDTTIKEFFLNNNSGITIHDVPELVGAFDGVNIKDGFIAYEARSGYIGAQVGLEPEPIAPQWKGFDYTTIYRSRFGGVVVRYPKSQCFRFGI